MGGEEKQFSGCLAEDPTEFFHMPSVRQRSGLYNIFGQKRFAPLTKHRGFAIVHRQML